MKKRLLLLILAGLLCLTGCSQVSANQEPTDISDEEESDDKDEKDDKKEDPDEDQDKEEDQDGQDEEDGQGDPEEHSDEAEGQQAKITVYSSNDDATAFESEEVRLDSLTPEAVLGALIDKGMVAADVGILSFETTTVEGKDTVEIDFDEAFASYMFSMGSTGEYYVIGSICNTFLDAYGCEQIKITVEGRTLETGHAEYPGYMNEFS